MAPALLEWARPCPPARGGGAGGGAASPPPRRRLAAPPAAIRARWRLDVRYGHKMEAVALLQEWAREVGAPAGLAPEAAALVSGAVGAPESRLELEADFPSLAALEAFWAAIAPEPHRAWAARLAPLVIDGSPTWEVYRTVPAFGEAPAAAAPAAAAPAVPSRPAYVPGAGRPRQPVANRGAGAKSTSAAAPPLRPAGGAAGGAAAGGLVVPSAEELARFATPAPAPAPAAPVAETPAGAGLPPGGEATRVVLDWKGDPMTINPGDRMPGL
jgi:hypothetical protein